MSRFQMVVVDPSNIQFELRATLTLAEWKEIRENLDPHAIFGATGWLKTAIGEMVSKANRDYRAWPDEGDAE